MSDEKMIRIDNLKLLLRQKTWINADLARAIERSDAYVSALLDGKKSFGEKTARHIEEKAGKPRGWLDIPHLGHSYENTDDAISLENLTGEQIAEYVAETLPDRHLSPLITSESSGRLLPIISWEFLRMLALENNSEELGQFPLSPAEGQSTTRTKWVHMPDSSMEDRFQEGSKLKVEPVGPEFPVKPGKFVVVRDRDGQHYVRRYRPIASSHFEAQPTNVAFGTLDSIRDGLTVVGIVTQALIDL